MYTPFVDVRLTSSCEWDGARPSRGSFYTSMSFALGELDVCLVGKSTMLSNPAFKACVVIRWHVYT